MTQGSRRTRRKPLADAARASSWGSPPGTILGVGRRRCQALPAPAPLQSLLHLHGDQRMVEGHPQLSVIISPLRPRGVLLGGPFGPVDEFATEGWIGGDPGGDRLLDLLPEVPGPMRLGEQVGPYAPPG